MENDKIIIYQTEDGQTQIDVRLENDMATKRLITSKELLRKLTNGEYKEIIEFAAKRENNLDVQIRDNYLNIYYRGGNLLRIHPRSFFFDEFYFHRNVKQLRKTHLIEKAEKGDKKAISLWTQYKDERQRMFDILKEKGGISRYCKEMKAVMDVWEEELNTIDISHDEKNEQQLISMNNRGETDYTVIDLEYAVSTTSNFRYKGNQNKVVPRFDIIAVDKTGQLYVIELKTGLGAIDNESGIGPHMDCFENTIGHDVKGEFTDEMYNLLEQKKAFKLINPEISIDKSKKPQFIFAFSNKPGEDKYKEFVAACKEKGYNGKIIYLDSSHQLKDV
jgi:hypothetical protein